jgi:hypothetical protein
LAERALQQKDYQQAEVWLEEGWAVAQQQTIPEYICRIRLAQGELFLAKQQRSMAHLAFEESLHLAEENPLLRAQALFGLARTSPQASEASQLGKLALGIFESIGHFQREAVQTWLKGVPPAFRLDEAAKREFRSSSSRYQTADRLKPLLY